MGKKKTYKLSEHEQQHNRVDYFRSIQIPKNNTQSEYTGSNFRDNEYTNPSFLASSNDLTFPNRLRQNIWSTSQSCLPSENTLQFNNNSGNLKSLDKRNQLEKNSKKRCALITLGIFIIILIFLTAIGLLIYQFYWKPKSNILKSCNDDCEINKYCVSNINSVLNSTCTCKPGFKLNIRTGLCDQATCYTGYMPYTYLNNQSPQDVSPYDTQFIRPYCCPNPKYLTNACCGMSTSSSSVTVSKRIIGGQTVNAGIFPWIVYVTLVHRDNPSEPLRMIRNCSGTLINERDVITAAHCLTLEARGPQFNLEFKNVESMIRIYFGFVDKREVFKPDVINEHERRAQKVIFHPKYEVNTLRNDLVIIRMQQPVNRNLNSDYLCLNTDSQDDTVPKLYTAGWGSTNPSHLSLDYPDQINYVDAVVFPMSFCKYIYPDPDYSFLFNATTHVCAGYQAAVGKDTCYADSGSPLMVQKMGQWFMYGIVTFGSQPDCAQGPSMFIRISYYADWIKSVVSF